MTRRACSTQPTHANAMVSLLHAHRFFTVDKDAAVLLVTCFGKWAGGHRTDDAEHPPAASAAPKPHRWSRDPSLMGFAPAASTSFVPQPGGLAPVMARPGHCEWF